MSPDTLPTFLTMLYKGGRAPYLSIKLHPSCQREDGKWVSHLRGKEWVTENQLCKTAIYSGEDWHTLYSKEEIIGLEYFGGNEVYGQYY